jgi:DNA polymerase-3 subunit epsilon
MTPRLVHWGALGAVLAVAGIGLALAWWLIEGGILPTAVALGLVLSVIVLVTALVWLVQDLAWLRPTHALSREIQLLTHAHADREPEIPDFHGLGELPGALRTLATRWREARQADDLALEAAGRRAGEQKRRLEAVLQEIEHGIIGCSTGHRILLFNDAARRILGAPSGLGLDRPLDRLVAIEPVRSVFRTLLDARLRGERGPGDATFVAASSDGDRLLRCRMGLIAGEGEEVQGYLLDVTDTGVARGGGAGHLGEMAQLARRLRGASANLVASAEILAEAGRDRPGLARFAAAVEQEGRRLGDHLDHLDFLLGEVAADAWPRADLLSSDLARQVGHHLDEVGSRAVLTPVGLPSWLHGDAFHLAILLEHLVNRIVARTARSGIDLAATREGSRVLLDLVHHGEVVPQGDIERWLEDSLAASVGGGLLGDIVLRHDGQIWGQAASPDHAGPRAVVRLVLPAGHGEPAPAPAPLPPRPEFYDFDLLARTDPGTSVRARPLDATTFVVFDTETTGLDPAGRDEIVQIAAVRIVNRRLLTGETFDRLVDPQRPIPKASIRFHGITQEMVDGRPPIEVVLPQFHDFADGAVLVAHNAAFDLAFIRKSEAQAGITFDQPVLDTLLLSTMLHDHTDEHGLDAIAQRFGVALTDRHHAIGDALGTAGVFLRMLDLLEARGVHTLGEALDLSKRAVSVRRRQAESFGRPAKSGVRAAESL